jgi:WD40 repeat protein
LLGKTTGVPNHLVWLSNDLLATVTLPKLFAGSSNQLVVWNARGKDFTRHVVTKDHQPHFVAAHPDGRHLATADYSDPRFRPVSPARLWTLGADGLRFAALPAEADLHGGLAFTPDGTALVGGAACGMRGMKDYQGRIVWWNLARGEPGQGFPGHAGLTTALAFSSAGTLLVSAGADQYIRAWDVPSRTEIGNRKIGRVDRRQPIAPFKLSPDGRMLALISTDVVVVLAPRAGKKLGKPRELTGHAGAVTCVAFAPDGRLGSVDSTGQIHLWNADGSLQKTLSPGPTPLVRLAFAPDGMTVAVADRTGQVILLDVD